MQQYFVTPCTSGIVGIGKVKAVEVFSKNAKFRKLMTTCTDRNATKDAISRAGEDALLLFYQIKEVKLNKLRHSLFYRKCATSLKAVKAKELPPTAAISLSQLPCLL